GFRHDVDVPARKLGGEAHVLAAAADGEAQLVVRHDDVEAVAVLVEDDLGDFRRGERVDDEGRHVVRPGDDVDFLALQFADDGLDARSAHAHAGADRVDGAVAGNDRDLGAGAGVARDGLDLDHAVVDFRHFLPEELGQEIGMGAGEENLRPALFAAHVVDIGAHAVAGLEMLAREAVLAAHVALAAAEVDRDVAVFHALDDARDDFARAVLVFLEHALALGVADLLEDDLLGGLGGDAAEIQRRQLVDDETAELDVLLDLLRVLQQDLLRLRLGVFRVEGLHHLAVAVEVAGA